MKKLLFAICAVAALASCSKEEVVSYDKGEVIGFANPFVNKSTRAATDPSYGAVPLTSFNVWGTANDVAIYKQDPVTGTVGSGEWTSTKKNYWIKGAAYKFAALANEGDASNVTLDATGLPTSVVFDATAANKDLIYATQTATGDVSNPAVGLTFSHLLSKAKFSVTNGPTTADGYSFKITNITVSGNKKGTATLVPAVGVTPATATWDTTSAPGNYTVNDITVAAVADNNVECDSELLLIPGSFVISFWVETYYNGNKVDTKKYVDTESFTRTLAVGTSYNFIINVSVGNEIKFSVATAPSWTPADDTLL